MIRKLITLSQSAAICLASSLACAGNTTPTTEQHTGLYESLENSTLLTCDVFDIDADPTIPIGISIGGTGNMFDSDNAYNKYAAQTAYADGIDAAWVCIDTYGTSSNPSSPTSLEVSYELDIEMPGSAKYKYRISMYNWANGTYDVIVPYTQLYGPFGSDQIVTATITSNVSDYINQSTNPTYTGRVNSRICVYSPKVGMFYPTYNVKFDHVFYELCN